MRASIAIATRCVLLIPLLISMTASAQTESEEEKAKRWSGSVTIGGGHSTGTVNSFNGSLVSVVQRDWESDRVRIHLDAFYGKSDGDVDTNEQRLYSNYRHNFTPRFFAWWNAEVGRNPIEAMKLRFVTTLGPGYRIWEQDEKSYLDGEIGFGYLHEDYLDGTSTRDDPELRAAYQYADVLGPEQRLEIEHGTEMLMPLNDAEAVLVRSRIGLAVPLIYSLKFNLTFDVEFQNEPAETAEKWNTTSVFGLKYDF